MEKTSEDSVDPASFEDGMQEKVEKRQEYHTLKFKITCVSRLALTYIKSVVFLTFINFFAYGVTLSIFDTHQRFPSSIFSPSAILMFTTLLLAALMFSIRFVSLFTGSRGPWWIFSDRRKRYLAPTAIVILFAVLTIGSLQRYVLHLDAETVFLVLSLVVVPAYFVVTRMIVILATISTPKASLKEETRKLREKHRHVQYAPPKSSQTETNQGKDQRIDQYFEDVAVANKEVQVGLSSASTAVDQHKKAKQAEVTGGPRHDDIFCPYCTGAFKLYLLGAHITKEHKGLLPKEIRCPFCYKEFETYADLDHALWALGRHIEDTHPDQPSKRSKFARHDPTLWPILAKKLVDDLFTFLNRKDYEVASFVNYLIARHRSNDDIILVKIEDFADIQQQSVFEQLILTCSRLRTFIDMLDQSKKATLTHVPRLNTNVITSFGWHAYENDSTRHAALHLATEVWGEQHILNLLGWLKNTWPKNPTVSQYSDIVRADYDWFEKQCVTIPRRRQELIARIKSELAGADMPPTFSRLLSIYEITHCFIIMP